MTHVSSIPSIAAYTRRGDSTARPEGDGSDSSVVRGKHYLHAGQYFASDQPTAVTTILGSCVAVCLWNPRLRVGGMNHFLLPDWAGRGRASPRFGNVAIASLIENLLSLGSKLTNLEAKIFGGASVIDTHRTGEGHLLGDRNINVARLVLKEEKIAILNEDVGGHVGRKVIYHTDSGEAWVKKL
jgi:chemotaxis protein CheD